MRNNPLVKAILALLHFADSVFSSVIHPHRVRDGVNAQRGVPNDPGRRPLKR